MNKQEKHFGGSSWFVGLAFHEKRRILRKGLSDCKSNPPGQGCNLWSNCPVAGRASMLAEGRVSLALCSH